ncbi:MAG: VanZ family protein [Gammaproteobacteria bacterium]
MRWEWLVLLAGVLATAMGCLLPMSRLPQALPNDKVLHFVAFGGMALMAGRLAQPGWPVPLALLAMLASSWLIEVLQNYVPGRRFCWRDMAANGAGIACAAVLLAVLPRS